MRITQVMLAMDFGGAERYFVDLCRALARDGHQVQAVCHAAFPGLSLIRDAHSNLSVTPIKVPGAWAPWGPRRVRSAVAGFGPDVMHVHMARAARFGGAAGRALGVPVVAKTHNYVNLKYYVHVDAFITTTADQRDYLLDQGVSPGRVEVIPNFSSMTPVKNPVYGWHRDGPVFATYGRMVHKKGFDVLLEAFARYCADGRPGRLLLGGDGGRRAELEALAARLGVADRIAFPGWVEDVPAFLGRADVFVLPSRDEPFGIAVLEAMALGRPVIATRTKGPLEILRPATAWFVDPDDAAGLTAAMAEVADSPQEASARAGLALGEFRTRFAEAVVVPRILATYQAVTGAPRRAAG